MPLFTKLTSAVAAGMRNDTVRLTQELLAAGNGPDTIVEQGLVPGMAIVGEQFKRNEIFVPEMLVAARAMKEALKLLEPLLAAAGSNRNTPPSSVRCRAICMISVRISSR